MNESKQLGGIYREVFLADSEEQRVRCKTSQNELLSSGGSRPEALETNRQRRRGEE